MRKSRGICPWKAIVGREEQAGSFRIRESDYQTQLTLLASLLRLRCLETKASKAPSSRGPVLETWPKI